MRQKSNVPLDWDIRDQLSWVNLLPGETPNSLNWSAVTALPTGMKISKGGVVQGTSALEGTFSFDAKATNNLVDQTSTFQLILDGAALAAKDISGTDQTACAVGINGKVYCWGHNGSGQLGNGTKTSSTTPVEVLGISNASKITVGLYHSCALTASGEIYCWGDNPLGQLGINSKVDALVPTLVSSLPPAIQVDAGDEFTCAVVTNGSVYCWGLAGSGRIGSELASGTVRTPLTVSLINDFHKIVPGINTTWAIRGSGFAKAWGNGASGRLGNGEQGDKQTPVSVLPLD